MLRSALPGGQSGPQSADSTATPTSALLGWAYRVLTVTSTAPPAEGCSLSTVTSSSGSLAPPSRSFAPWLTMSFAGTTTCWLAPAPHAVSVFAVLVRIGFGSATHSARALPASGIVAKTRGSRNAARSDSMKWTSVSGSVTRPGGEPWLTTLQSTTAARPHP
jgi:hypothetical protein